MEARYEYECRCVKRLPFNKFYKKLNCFWNDFMFYEAHYIEM